MHGLNFADPDLEARITAGVEEAERQLAEAVRAPEKLVAEAAAHLMRAGGKRIRPLLVTMAAEFGDPSAPLVPRAAIAVELIHLATLYHDDVMDEAAMRRGADSANARWNNSLAILVGDFLFARASEVTAELGPEAVRIQAQTFARLVRGQIRETIGPEDGDDPLQHYLGVVADKTGSLIATSARFGAMISGASADVEETLTEFGERIGSAFQLRDDIIDIASETDDSGKTPGTDLREGVPTLPVLIALRDTDAEHAHLRDALSRPVAEDEVADVLRALRVHPAMDQARDLVLAEGDAARNLLDKLPDTSARAALASLCDVIATRMG